MEIKKPKWKSKSKRSKYKKMSISIMPEEKNKVNTIPKWSEKKTLNTKIAEKMINVDQSARGRRVMLCSRVLGVEKCENCGKEHVSSAKLCRDRVCPICQWRLARKRAFEMLQCLDDMNENGEYKYQFLTLTQKNVTIFQLRRQLKKMSKAWNKVMSSNKKNKPAGCARVTEITYNEKEQTFHPHMHVIIAWEKEQTPYKRLEWQERWKKALEINYTPICRLQAIKPKKEHVKYTKAVLETFKYSLKASDLLKMPDGLFDGFLFEISGTRACSYTGIFRKTRQKLSLKEDTKIEENDEEETQCKNCGAELSNSVMVWSFASKEYKQFTGFEGRQYT